MDDRINNDRMNSLYFSKKANLSEKPKTLNQPDAVDDVPQTKAKMSLNAISLSSSLLATASGNEVNIGVSKPMGSVQSTIPELNNLPTTTQKEPARKLKDPSKILGLVYGELPSLQGNKQWKMQKVPSMGPEGQKIHLKVTKKIDAPLQNEDQQMDAPLQNEDEQITPNENDEEQQPQRKTIKKPEKTKKPAKKAADNRTMKSKNK